MRFSLVVALTVVAAASLAGQVPSLPSTGAPFLRFSGQLASYGELYDRSGTPGRRPGGTGRASFNGNLVLLGSVTVGIDLLATTEDGTSLGYGGLPGRQGISRFGLHPQWTWGRAHLGSYSDSYTPLTLSGVQLTGAAVDLNPGRVRFGAFGGRAASAVVGGATTGSYTRTMAGLRLGFGPPT